VTDHVRALLITPGHDLLAIKRYAPGKFRTGCCPAAVSRQGRIWKTALARELREEIAATADVHSLLYALERGPERQYFYLARVRSWSADPGERTGPEFAEPSNGESRVQAVPLTAEALMAIDLKRSKPRPLNARLVQFLPEDTGVS
jgi:hypothetical protein